MPDGGYIRIFRSLQDHPLWRKKPFSRGQAWVDLIMLAAYRDHTSMGKSYKRGQVNASQLWLGNRWGWTRQQVRCFLNRLVDEGMITQGGQKRTNVGSYLTIVNYESYQSDNCNQQPSKPKTGTKQRTKQGTKQNQDAPTTYRKSQPSKEPSKEPNETGKSHTDKAIYNHNRRSKNTLLNTNNSKGELNYLELIPDELNTPDFIRAWGEWELNKREIKKKLTPRAAAMQLRKLAPVGPKAAVEAIEQAIASGWQSIHPRNGQASPTTRGNAPVDQQSSQVEIDEFMRNQPRLFGEENQ